MEPPGRNWGTGAGTPRHAVEAPNVAAAHRTAWHGNIPLLAKLATSCVQATTRPGKLGYCLCAHSDSRNIPILAPEAQAARTDSALGKSQVSYFKFSFLSPGEIAFVLLMRAFFFVRGLSTFKSDDRPPMAMRDTTYTSAVHTGNPL